MIKLVSCVVALLMTLTTALSIEAAEPVLFVSAFAAGDQGAIHAFRFDGETGSLTLLERTTDIENPFFIAVSPNGRFLYAIHADQFGGKDDEFVAAYAINGRSGKLTRLNQQTAHGTASCYLDVDASGKTVVVANYSTGNVASFPVQADGSLGPSASVIQHEGSSVNPKRQDGPYAHSIEISPDNRFALAADLGTDKVFIYQLDPGRATLVPNAAQPFAAVPPGSGPRHVTFHPNSQHAYVINELLNTVSVFDYSAEQGTLKRQQDISTLPADFEGTSYCADLKVTPDGRFLYGTNRGHDSIAAYRIGEDGRLTLLAIEPSLGKGPQNLLITPDGRWLLCANMPGKNVVVFAIDPHSGKISPTGEPVAVPGASCIRWLP